MPAAYPLMLDVTERLAVIVGGGAVAVRKATGLIEAGATRIRMVAPAFHQDVPAMVEKIAERYQPRHLDAAGLVFAATDSPEINDQIVREARQRGIWVNRANSDEAEPGDFTTPALLRQGRVTITVSTAGVPALAAKIRDELLGRFDPRWRQMAEAMRTIRPMIHAATMTPDRRRDAFRALATDDAMTVLSEGGAESLWKWLLEKYPELSVAGGPPVSS